MRKNFGVLVLALLAACSHTAAPPSSSSTQETPLAFSNGGFETGDTTGWTVTANKNVGITTVPPAQVSDLALATGGTALTAAKTGATESVVPPNLLSTDSLRYPKYGQWAVEVNSKSSIASLHGQNVNTLTQQMTTTAADVDTDGKVHVRFVLAPVIQATLVPHALAQQPYYYLEVRNVTKSTLLASSFHTVGDAGLPWKTSLSGAQYTDWQAFDVAPGGAALAVGDVVKVTAIAAGCAVGDHYSVLYLDGFGTSLPGVSVVATAQSSVNAGDNITYTYVVKNGGTLAASNVSVTNNLPAGTTFQSISANGATCTTPLLGVLGPVTCNVGTLNPSASTTFSVTVKTYLTGTITNADYNAAAQGGSPLIGPSVTTNVTQAVAYADLAITNTDGTSATTPGSPLVYTVVASNNGPSTATGAIITDTFSAQLTNVTWTCVSIGGTCGALVGTGNLNTTATLPSGSSATYTILGTVATSATGSLVSTATIAAPSGVTDSTLTNNSAVDTDGIGTLRLITLAKVGVVGTGTVTSSPAAISCGPACVATTGTLVDGSTVTFTAVAASGSTFGGWSGACSGTGTCTLTLSSDVSIGASFVLPTYAVSASVPGGGGTVTCVPSVAQGSPDACIVVPSLGQALSSLTDNGTDVTAQVLLGTYTLTDVSAAHSLIAVFKANLGTQCTSASDCGSGSCVDGVCCNTACNGQCQACDVPGLAGTCTPVVGAPHGTRTSCGGDTGCGGICDGITVSACTYPTTQCAAPGCTNDTASAASFCDGAGHCPAATTTSCGAYGCGLLNTCNTGCGATPCGSGTYCLAAVCVPQVPQGGLCLSDAACGTGHCVDGICCDTGCTGQCAACNVPGKVGTCSATKGAPVGLRPACTSDGLCGGSCDGTSTTACTYPTSVCVSASCSSGLEISASTCDGAGHCNVPAESSCGAFACGGSSCKATCSTQSDCGADAFCLAGLCLPRLGGGQLCTDASQCGSGFCSGGVCCDTACDGSCSACNLPTHVGTCTPLTLGSLCTQASCSLNVAVTGAACNGVGLCIPGISTSCPLGCSGNTCNTITVPLGDGGITIPLPLPDAGIVIALPDLGGIVHLPHPDLGAPDLGIIEPLDLGQPGIGVDLSITIGIGTSGDMAQPTEAHDMAHATTTSSDDMAHATTTSPDDLATASSSSPDLTSTASIRGGGCDMSGTSRTSLGAPLLLLAALFLVRRRRVSVRI